jgi:hypothetical protein
METKTSKAISMFASGSCVEAMRIFRTFKIGFTADEKRMIEIAHESRTGNDKFYRSIGIDTDEVWKKAKEIIRRKYKVK